MDKTHDWWAETPSHDTSPTWYPTPPPPPKSAQRPAPPRRRTWPTLTVITALAVAIAGVWKTAADDKRERNRAEQAATYKGVSATDLTIDGITVETLASWEKDGRSATLSAWADADTKQKLIRITSSGKTAEEETHPPKKNQSPMPIPMPTHLEVTVPTKDRYQPVRLKVTVSSSHHQPTTREIEFRPDRTATDTATGKHLPQHH
ncbi:hypothetical protein [Streptomyces sp. NRRL F-5053]|uniref:hypothetical protein n=1 Tax=Streptomyces sp. NRRL F-5053 TaxID=1463854 RepID=UPI0013312F67|nr:hypothetical protein [Streptomyces sp. NRRL F-5053]